MSKATAVFGSLSQPQCSSVSSPAERLQKGRAGFPSATVLVSLLEVAHRGQLRPRRRDGPSFPEEPAGQGPPHISRGEDAQARA